jgi:hypothetical protein
MRGPMTSRNTRGSARVSGAKASAAAAGTPTPGTPATPHTGAMGVATADVELVVGSGGGLPSLENFRDLASALPGMRRGRVLRSAKPVHLSEEDVRTLRDTLRIRDILDLRSPKELSEDPPKNLLYADSETQPYLRSWTGQITTAPSMRSFKAARVMRHNVSFISKLRYYTGMLYHIPLLSTLYAALVVVVNRDAARKCMVKEINAGGLGLMYKTCVRAFVCVCARGFLPDRETKEIPDPNFQGNPWRVCE